MDEKAIAAAVANALAATKEPAAGSTAASSAAPAASAPAAAPTIDYEKLASAIAAAIKAGSKEAAEPAAGPPQSGNPLLDAILSLQGESKPAQYHAPGAPAGRVGEVSPNPFQWTKDDIAAMQRSGTFLKRLEEYRLATEGGPAVFRRKVPGA